MNLQAIRDHRFPPVEQAYSVRDTILYALGLGYGDQPGDPAQLRHVYEEGLQAVPSQCVVLAHPGFWARNPAFGIDALRLLHGEQAYDIHAPLPPSGTVRGEYEITAVEDKGEAKGAILHQVKRLYDFASESDSELRWNEPIVW